MSIPSGASLIYRITSYHQRRGDLPAGSLAGVVAAMNADTSGQYQHIASSGKTIIYDYAPKTDINADPMLNLVAAIEWNGLRFSVVNATRLKGF